MVSTVQLGQAVVIPPPLCVTIFLSDLFTLFQGLLPNAERPESELLLCKQM